MAKKPTITTVATGYNATDTVNANFTNIRNAFDNTLSLDGSTPNAMEADLDMNSKDILNVKNIYVDNIIYEGALPVVNGGTGATTASGARTNLGLGTMATETASNYLTTSTAASTYLTQSSAASTYLTQTTADGIYQPLDGDLTSIAGLSGTSGILKKTGASTYTLDTTTYLTSSEIGVTVQGYDADLTALGGLSKTDGNFIVGDGTTWVVESGSTARASLGLGTMATETASNYLTTATASSTYQPLDSDLTTIAGLAKTDGNFIVGDGTNWVTESGSTVRASLGLGTMATETASNYLTTSSAASTYLTQTNAASTYLTQTNAASTYLTQTNAASTYLTQTNAASTYQPLDADLTAISSLSNADNNFIVGNGTTWVAESGSTARASLGLGTAATSNSTDFAAASHTHTASNITDFSEAVDDRVNGLLVAGSNVTLTYDDFANTLTIASTGGSGSISDGDKGDITVSSSGTVWTIDNTAVTYAKIQNISATDKLLGRSTAGAGSIEEITCTAAGRAILDDADAAAQRTTLGAAASGSVTTSGLTQTSSRILGRTTATAGAIEELTVGTGLTLSAGSLSVTTNTYQPLDADLTAIAALTGTSGFLKTNGAGTWTVDTNTYLTTGTAASTYQPLDADLTAIAGLTPTADNFIVGNGTTWTAETPAQARTSLGLGSLATQSGTFSGTSSGTNTGDQNIFQTVAVSGQTSVVADSTADTLTLAAGSNVTITTDATTDTITISATSSTFPSGTRMLFQQTSAPTGWTKDTAAGTNNSALRIVTGTVSSGGTVNFGTAFSSTRSVTVTMDPVTPTGTVNGHALTLTQIPPHTHSVQGGLQSNTATTGTSDRVNNLTGSGTTGTTGSTGGSAGSAATHNHGLTMNSFTPTGSGSVNLDVKYIDFIIAQKD